MKRRGGLRQNFIYQWNRHLQAEVAISLIRTPAVKTTKNNTSVHEHLSAFFIEVRLGQPAELPIRSSQVFKGPARSLTCYSRFNHHTEQSSSLWFADIKTFSRQLFLIAEGCQVLSWTPVVVRLDLPSGLWPAASEVSRPVKTNIFANRFFQQFSFEKVQ